jgi:sugar/nucleoside kinase (ribokinase family)
MTTPALDILGIGSPIIDLVVDVSEAELAAVGGAKGGMKLIGPEALPPLLALRAPSTIAPGGSAANTTFALAELGLRCGFLGTLGADSHADHYRAAFHRVGGDCSRFKAHPTAATACCVSLVTPDSERTMRTCLGAAAHFSPAEVVAEDFAGCRHVHIEGYLFYNPGLLPVLLDAAKAAGCGVSLDLGSFEVVRAAGAGLPDLLRHVDVVFANEEEAAAFSGSRDPLAGLEALRAHCPTAVVKVGKDGAWIQQGDERAHVPAAPVPGVKDTTGAGDYWAAGFLYGYLRGAPPRVSGALGALASSQVIQYPGAVVPAAAWDALRAARPDAAPAPEVC